MGNTNYILEAGMESGRVPSDWQGVTGHSGPQSVCSHCNVSDALTSMNSK